MEKPNSGPSTVTSPVWAKEAIQHLRILALRPRATALADAPQAPSASALCRCGRADLTPNSLHYQLPLALNFLNQKEMFTANHSYADLPSIPKEVGICIEDFSRWHRCPALGAAWGLAASLGPHGRLPSLSREQLHLLRKSAPLCHTGVFLSLQCAEA